MTRPVLRRVSSLDEAAEILAELGDDAVVLSGGQSLIPMMSAGLAAPAVLVDINRVPAEGPTRRDGVVDGAFVIGTGVRHRDLEFGQLVSRAQNSLLEPAAALIAHAAVRNRGTFVGSIAHADPAAEWPAIALALDATVTLHSASGERKVPIGEFLIGPMMTARRADEVVASVTIPLSQPGTGAAVRELTYRHGDYAVVGAAAQVTLDPNGGIADARLVLFGVDATPVRATAAEQAVIEGGEQAFADAATLAQDAADPITDATASAGYRRDMIPVMAQRALRAALADSHAMQESPARS
jgi:carbon-monoxide dehydrogenase medium subunit